MLKFIKKAYDLKKSYYILYLKKIIRFSQIKSKFKQVS
jgi:hypothetical protein